MSSRALRVAALAFAALVAAACSFTKLAYMNAAFAYSNATPVLTWLVDDYVDLSGPQRDFVRERLARAFAWHRADELPEYNRFLESVLRQVEDNLSVEEARADYRELRARYYRMVERILPDVADFVLQLDAEQAAQMERKFAEDNRKMLSEATRGSAAARFERRVKRVVEHMEEFVGPLDGAQRELLTRHMSTTVDPYEERLADRRYRQTELLALVRARPARDEAIAVLRRLTMRPETWRTPEYMKKLQLREEKLLEMLSALSATLSAEQRAFFQKRVRGFMRDISALAAGN